MWGLVCFSFVGFSHSSELSSRVSEPLPDFGLHKPWRDNRRPPDADEGGARLHDNNRVVLRSGLRLPQSGNET